MTRHLVAIGDDDHGEFFALGMSYQGFSAHFSVNLNHNFNILVSKLNSFKLMNYYVPRLWRR